MENFKQEHIVLNNKKLLGIAAYPAYAQNGRTVIGNKGRMPWEGLIPSDMKRFRHLTSQIGMNSVLVGRPTYLSVDEKYRPFDKNLPVKEARQTIVLTRDKDFTVDDPRVVVAHSLVEGVGMARCNSVWVAGGGEVYKEAMPYMDELHITMIYGRFEGDTFFPSLEMDSWCNVYFKHFNLGDLSGDQLRTSYLVFERRS